MEREDSTGTWDSFSFAALHSGGTSSLLPTLLLNTHTYTHTEADTQAVASSSTQLRSHTHKEDTREMELCRRHTRCTHKEHTHTRCTHTAHMVHTHRAHTHTQSIHIWCTHTQSTHNKPAHRDWLMSAPRDKECLLTDSMLLSLAQQGTPTGNPPIPGPYTQLWGCGKVPITFGSVEIHLHRGIPTGVQDFPGPNLLYGHDG